LCLTPLSAIASATIERGVIWVCYPCDIFISVKVSPLLCFQNSKVWIPALEEDRKAMVFDQNWTKVGRSNNCVNVWLGGYGV
jgi:hypothetical protein